jgi:hypothetical protein
MRFMMCTLRVTLGDKIILEEYRNYYKRKIWQGHEHYQRKLHGTNVP